MIVWPVQLPDLNPIKHLRAILGRKIRDRLFRKKEDLKDAILKAWYQIDPKEIKNLVEPISRHKAAVIKAKEMQNIKK